MGETVSIPREEYDFLKRCEEVLYEDIEEQFSESFIKKVKMAQSQLKRGQGKTIMGDEEMNRYFEAL